MVKLINNVPCEYVDKFDTDIEFILLHKILDNEKYRNYYIEHCNAPKYKILDNGAYELGKGLSNNILLEWAIRLKVDEVIAPDDFRDKDKTLDKLRLFLKHKDSKRFKIQAVPQGRNYNELIECYKEMMNIPEVKVIGFNKLWNRYDESFQNLLSMTKTLGKEVHLLGVNSLRDWVELYNNRDIRSADSRILSKIVSGQDDTWEVRLTADQYTILKVLHKEVMAWQK